MISSFIPAAPLQVVEGIQALNAEDGEDYPALREAVGLQDKLYRRIPTLVDQLPKKYNWLTGKEIRNPDAFSTGFPIVPDKTTEAVGSELVALKYPFPGVHNGDLRVSNSLVTNTLITSVHGYNYNQRNDADASVEPTECVAHSTVLMVHRFTMAKFKHERLKQ